MESTIELKAVEVLAYSKAYLESRETSRKEKISSKAQELMKERANRYTKSVFLKALGFMPEPFESEEEAIAYLDRIGSLENERILGLWWVTEAKKLIKAASLDLNALMRVECDLASEVLAKGKQMVDNMELSKKETA